MHIEISMYCYV
uniref:Uncharacterized protein n=1 Tax=Anguilla anguilla TaxID=7936 RepID=A0A0E9TMW8_ANGAN